MAASAKIEVQERLGRGFATVLIEYTPIEGETECTVPEGITEIAPWAFSACGMLKRVLLPESLRVIGEYAFDHCTGIREMVIPKHVVTIGTGAFHQCTALRRVCCRTAKKPDGWVDYETVSCCTEDRMYYNEIRYYSWLFGVTIRMCELGAARSTRRRIPGACKVVWNYMDG
jgi:hypothetical protein